MISKLARVGVAVADMPRALALYSDILGLREQEVAGEAVTLAVGGSSLRLEEADGRPEGIAYLAFEDAVECGRDLPAAEHHGLTVLLVPPRASPGTAPGHVLNIDHVVIASNDSAALAGHFRDGLGIEIRRTMSRPGTGAHLEFAKLGDVILEFAGPPEPRPGPLNARYWGMVFAVDDLEAVAAGLRAGGFGVSEARPAVQPGAVIATVKGYTGGVPLALIQYSAR
jgi:catechol 2,3-dioxygenase-like lactoylglutathione lyase family enzyme